MNFNFFLLLLSSLIAVALSQLLQVPGKSKIREYFGDLSWALDDELKVVLKQQGIDWDFKPLHDDDGDVYLISSQSGYLRYNGPGEQLAVYLELAKSTPLQWKIKVSPLPIYPPIFYICSNLNHTECATAVGGKVIAKEQDHSREQSWRLGDF